MDPEAFALHADNREMLTNEIPALVKQLYTRLDSASLEAWHTQLTSKLISSIEKNCQELLRSMDEEWLSETAWIARNLLELWIWASFCAASRENARRFYEDALRDVKGLCDSLNKASAVRGLKTLDADTALAQVASTKLGVTELDAKFLNVSDAAKAVGLHENSYAPLFKMLSKFAHPTAGLVIGLAHQEEHSRGLQTTCATMGVFFARKGSCQKTEHYVR